MSGRHRLLWMFAIGIGLLALSGCQQATQTAGTATPTADVTQTDRWPDASPCPDQISAVLANGVVVHFLGATDGDPDICVQEWNGRTYHYYLGFWGKGRFNHGTAQQREALAAILRGPVGATTTVDLHGPTAPALWKSATVTHESDTSLRVGRDKRPVMKLRIVRKDTSDRNTADTERLLWLDRATGIPLKKQTVTRTADGEVWHITTWDVSSLRSASAEPSGDSAMELE